MTELTRRVQCYLSLLTATRLLSEHMDMVLRSLGLVFAKCRYRNLRFIEIFLHSGGLALLFGVPKVGLR